MTLSAMTGSAMTQSVTTTLWTFCIAALVIGVAPGVSQQLPHRITNGWADLRNDQVLTATEPDHVHGRRLLEAAADTHGLEAWLRHETLQVIATDHWAQASPWWPSQHQKLRLEQLLRTFTSRAVLLGNEKDHQSQTIGLQSWAPYSIDPSGKIAFSAEPNPTASFYLPTLHYFNELPFRLLSAPVSIAAGEVTLESRLYDRVFVTWGDGEPSGEYDQYVLWIDRETGLISKAHYTVRESEIHAPPEQRETMRAAAVGTIHYQDYREVGDVKFAYRHVVTLFGPEEAQSPLSENYFHMLEVEAVRFDEIEPDDLIPDKKLATPADRKVRVP